MRKLIYALITAALLTMGAMTAAHAAYSTVTGSVQAGGTIAAGTTQTFTAGGFKVGSSVGFDLHSDPIHLGDAIADSTGTATGTFTIPANLPPGTHTVSAQGVDPSGKPRTVTSGSFNVVAAGTSVLGAAQNRTSARTGARNTVPLTVGGVVLVGAGAGLVTITRRRRTAAPATT